MPKFLGKACLSFLIDTPSTNPETHNQLLEQHLHLLNSPHMLSIAKRKFCQAYSYLNNIQIHVHVHCIPFSTFHVKIIT